jgi:hypothetical protein
MNYQSFVAAVKSKNLPVGITIYQETLWYAGTGNWQKAHELIQDEPGKSAALLHAYLHRVEGDQRNADYWYRKAGESRPALSLYAEWETLVKRFI